MRSERESGRKDFSEIGGKCKQCNHFSYLPMKCNKCTSFFCHDHFSDHHCFNNKNKISEIASFTDGIKTMDCHFCGDHKKLNIYFTCSDCKETFCSQHRLIYDHSCPSLKSVKKHVVPKSTLEFLNHSFFQMPRGCNGLVLPSGRSFLLKKKLGQGASVDGFVNDSANPVVVSKFTDGDDRKSFVVGFVFPFELDLRPVFMKVCSDWKLGRFLDYLISFAPEVIAEEQVLQFNFFSLSCGKKLKKSFTFSELLSSGDLASGDTLVFERRDIDLDESIRRKLDSFLHPGIFSSCGTDDGIKCLKDEKCIKCDVSVKS